MITKISNLANASEIFLFLNIPETEDEHISIIDSIPSRSLYLLFSNKYFKLKGFILENINGPRYFCEPAPYSFEISFEDFEKQLHHNSYSRYDQYLQLKTENPTFLRAAFSKGDHATKKKWIFSTNKKLDVDIGDFFTPSFLNLHENNCYVFTYSYENKKIEALCAQYIRCGLFLRRVKLESNIQSFEKPFLYFNPISGLNAKIISKKSIEEKADSIIRYRYVMSPEETRKKHSDKQYIFDQIDNDKEHLPFYIAECYKKRYSTSNFIRLHPEEYYIITQVREKESKPLLLSIINELKSSTNKQIFEMINHMHETALGEIE